MNATLSGNKTEFKCKLPSDVFSLTWFINGTSAVEIGEHHLIEQGILYESTLNEENGAKYGCIYIQPTLENNSTEIQCVANTLGAAPLASDIVVLKLQGEKPLQSVLLF